MKKARRSENPRAFLFDDRLAAAAGEQADQTAEQPGTEAIHMHAGTRGARRAAHFREHVGREIDPEFAAGCCVVTHLLETPLGDCRFRMDVREKCVSSLLAHMAGMMCGESHC